MYCIMGSRIARFNTFHLWGLLDQRRKLWLDESQLGEYAGHAPAI
jgi:hypothetical protein